MDNPPAVPQPDGIHAATARLAWGMYSAEHDMNHPATAEAAREGWTGDFRDTPGRRARWHGRARVLLAMAFPCDTTAVVTTDAGHGLTPGSVVAVAGRQANVPETSTTGGDLFWHRVNQALAAAGYALASRARYRSYEGYIEFPVRRLGDAGPVEAARADELLRGQ